MKRILKKNQVVLTLLAVMIAVAGYLNYTADGKMQNAQITSQDGNGLHGLSGELLEISDEDILAENKALSAALQETFDGSEERDDQEVANQAEGDHSASGQESDGENVQDTGKDTPGTAVLTSGTTVLDYVAGVQLSREQTRAKSKESLMEIIDNTNLDEDQKQAAIETMLHLTAIAEKETAAESLLAAKGFENSVVYINDKSVDVVICRTALTDAERAQIEDIVKRKAEVTADKIVLTLLEIKNQE
ncbi:MAG: SpoIIIAH-like family protein [Lachnospiraceae bacterium]|nr:SpoIIIAH-like family protein [Lachnospiraceae bacterium]